MMLSKKSNEALENFSEKLEVEGRSFMAGRPAVVLCITVPPLPA
ncbi:Oligopeptide transport system permease protein oppC [Raoultella planticola]|uniref:Oligopeptide transport system permease protein oppC n=1 Tax=Raoultella planticola TaxID=575 RepID=A0A485AEZ8_RAOPL|nr:Oligopeptide transport system permease protein oppC [Raoultella planticola]